MKKSLAFCIWAGVGIVLGSLLRPEERIHLASIDVFIFLSPLAFAVASGIVIAFLDPMCPYGWIEWDECWILFVLVVAGLTATFEAAIVYEDLCAALAGVAAFVEVFLATSVVAVVIHDS